MLGLPHSPRQRDNYVFRWLVHHQVYAPRLCAWAGRVLTAPKRDLRVCNDSAAADLAAEGDVCAAESEQG